MIKSKYVEATWNSNYQKHFMSLGYEKHKIGEKFVTKVEDLPLGTRTPVTCICDNCGDEFQRAYFRVAKSDKHFCKKQECITKQMNYAVQKKYNVDCAARIPSAINKRVKTFKSHYGKIENPEGNKQLTERKNTTYFNKTGYENPRQNPTVLKKMADTYESKTGYRNPFSNPEVVKSNIPKALATKHERGNMTCSAYQKHLHELLENSKLNYPVDRTSIDIAYPDEFIGIEYNGAGHFCRVRMGSCTLEEAETHDKRRCYFLYKSGWKLIHIDNFTNKKPYDDSVMVNLIMLCKQHLLSTSHTWVRIDIDNDVIYGSDFSIHLNVAGKFNQEGEFQ